jgi:multidrug efflux pump subunit AcrB
MSTAKFCIRHKVTTLLAVIMIAIFGAVFTTQLQMALLPDMEAPMAVVACYYNGATPSDMEELVTRPLESAIVSVPGVEGVSSTSSDGVTQIQVTYVEGTDLDIAAAKLREKFNLLSLPDGAMDPIIMNLNVSDLMPTAMVALMGEDLADLQTLAEEVVAPALERIDGVASVTVSGGVTEQIAVQVDPARAAGFGLSNSYIQQILAAENLLYPAGDVYNGSKTLTVSTDAKFQSVEDVANLILPLPTGGQIRLGEVAEVELETTDRETVAVMDGAPCVLLQVSKQSGANESSTAKAVESRMAQLAAENRSVRYALPYLASDFIHLAVSAAFQNIILGVALAAVVVFLFLRRWGATLTIAVSMPVCILAVFVLMNLFDLTLNMMSLGGIAMGVGMIVDNSIVVLENIYRYAADGHDRMTACVEGTKEVTTSVIASTLTTVAVFLPLGLTGGMAGMLFDDFCLTISFLILGSMAIALTWVPLLCYLLLDETKLRQDQLKRAQKTPHPLLVRVGGWVRALYDRYIRLLDYFVHHLKAGMLTSLALVVFFSVCCLSAGMVLLPPMDQGQISITISTPIGSQVQETTAIAERVAAVAEANVPELKSLYYTAQDETASVSLTLSDKSDRRRGSDEIADSLRPLLQTIAGCEMTIVSTDMGAMMGGSEISVDITGDDYATLAMIADDLGQQISALEDAVDVSSSVAEQVPQVEITMNREAAAQYGLTAAQVGAAVRAELTGDTATTVTLNSKELDVIVRGDGSAAASLDTLRSMPVATAMGGYVPLSSVAEVEVIQAPQTITRNNQSRQVSITGSTLSGDVTAMTAQINAILDAYQLPEGYTAAISGTYEEMMDSFSDLLLALLVALGLVYFVLAAQFESFLMPVIIMMILPVAFSGALFALPLTGRDLSMIALVALIMLAGTVVNNSIILVDYIKIRREMGESREEAILHACPLRIRPVMMTTLTTVLAMIPMAAAMGDTLEMMSDMGITMMSGMIISTIVTLLFTPVYYSVIDDLPRRLRRKKKSLPPAGGDGSDSAAQEPLPAPQAPGEDA